MDAVALQEWVELESQGFSAYVGPIFMRNYSGDGPLLYKLDAQERHRNRRGFIHGGAIMTLGDIAVANALRTIDPSFRYVTVQSDFHFVEAARLDLSLMCECTVQKRGRSLAFVDARFTSGDTVVASAKTIWRILENR